MLLYWYSTRHSLHIYSYTDILLGTSFICAPIHIFKWALTSDSSLQGLRSTRVRLLILCYWPLVLLSIVLELLTYNGYIYPSLCSYWYSAGHSPPMCLSVAWAPGWGGGATWHPCSNWTGGQKVLEFAARKADKAFNGCVGNTYVTPIISVYNCIYLNKAESM